MPSPIRGHQDTRWNQRDLERQADDLLEIARRYRAIFSSEKLDAAKPVEFQVLLSLYRHREFMTINELARRFSASHTAIANAVLSLERDGYLSVAYRAPRDGDTREKQIALTSKGKSRTRQLTSIAAEVARELA